MRTSLRRSAIVGLALTAVGLVGQAMPAFAACVPGTAICVYPPGTPETGDPARQLGPVFTLVNQAQDTAGGSDDPFDLVYAVAADIGRGIEQVGHDVAGNYVYGPGIYPEYQVNQTIQTAARGLGDAAQGLGGVGIGPLPAPTPGIRPEEYVNGAIQTVARGLGDAAQGLGGVGIGPLPAPTPGIRPETYANAVIQTAGNSLVGVGRTLQGGGPRP